ncbi:MAG TPA: helix-turn-helix domain-containing protein [Rhizomicrobium sp.]|jgi:HTH-type transcriptional regulator/antitoxin HigA|nr:helix-turn-helix domain-containing protein [Rhizomicrobium sp.]
MDLHPIRSEKDHNSALREIERLWGAKQRTPEGDRLEILLTLVDAYEEQHWPIAPSDPIEAIRFRMEQAGHTQAELASLLGSQSRASEILKRKRPLTLQMIWKLHEAWGIPAEILIRPYETVTA